MDGLKKLSLNPLDNRSPISVARIEESPHVSYIEASPPGMVLEPVLHELVSPASPTESSDLG